MPKSGRRVTARDVALAGSKDAFVKQLIDSVINGNMESKEKAAGQVRSLTEQHKEDAILLTEAGAIKPLVALVANGTSNAQGHACVALSSIGKAGEEYREAILEAGGVLPITNVLRIGDSALQEQAAAAIESVSELEASRVPFIKAGAIPPLVSLLKIASADTHVHVCQALANLANKNLEGQNIIARAGALPLLIALLGSGKAQEAAAHAIASLSYENPANQAEVTQLGGIPKLIALLTVMSMDAQAQAAAALAAVASGEIKDVIAKAGGIRPLLVLVESRYPNAERNAANALAMLALDHRSNQDSIASMGGIDPLCKLTEHGHGHAPDVQAQAVLALTEMSRHNREIQTAITEHGAISSLVALLRQSNSPMVEAEVAGAFWALSEDHPENKVAIAGAGAIPALMTQLSSTMERANTNAANALSSLAYLSSANQVEIAALLVGLLEDGSEAAQDRAAQALWRMVDENPGNEVLIAKAGGTEPLVRLLSSTQPSSQAYALWSLSLSIDSDNQKMVAETGGIAPLVHLLSSKRATQCEQAACAIQRLATNNHSTQVAIAEQGAIEPLIQLLQCEGETRSPEYAAAALSELASITANKVAIDDAGGIPPLVALLAEEHSLNASKRYASATIAKLSAEEKVNKTQARPDQSKDKSPQKQPAEQTTKTSAAEKIAVAGAIPSLVKILSGDYGSEAQEEAAGALLALAESERNRKLITDAGGIAPIVLLLGCQNAQARDYAEGALVRLSIEKSTRAIIIQRLVGMLDKERSTSAQEQATAALVNLARESTENRMSILEAGGIPKLLQLMGVTSHKVIENAVSAISQLAYQNKKTQAAIAVANGVAILVRTLSINKYCKEESQRKLCELTAEAIWNLANENKHNQSLFLQEGVNEVLVSLVNHPTAQLQTNTAGALAALAKDHPDNQASIYRANGITHIVANVRDGNSWEAKEEAAAALWALATDNNANKKHIAELGGVDPLVSMLLFGSTDRSAVTASGALAALATQHPDNRSTITKKLVAGLDANAPPARAVRFLGAVAVLCDNEAQNQETFAKSGGIQHLIFWLANTTEEAIQIPSAKAMLAVAGNNPATQAIAGKLNAIPHLVALMQSSSLDAREHSACAVWHLATLPENRMRIFKCKGIPPLVKLLPAESQSGPQIAAMALLRLAEGSSKAAATIAAVGGIKPLVRLLSRGTPAAQQIAAAALAAVGLVAGNRDLIANAGAVERLVGLLNDPHVGTPETAARALAHLAWDDRNNEERKEETEEDGMEEVKTKVSSSDFFVDDEDDENENEERGGADAKHEIVAGFEQRRTCIKNAGGIKKLVSMLDGSNLNLPEPLKPLTIGGWAAARVGITGCIELDELFVGARVSFGERVGMQEQAAATLSYLASRNRIMQDAIITDNGVPPLLSLVRDGSQMAQEQAARTIWSLSMARENQKVLVKYAGFITDMVTLLKNGSQNAQFNSAAALAELCDGRIQELKDQGGGLQQNRAQGSTSGINEANASATEQSAKESASADAMLQQVKRRRSIGGKTEFDVMMSINHAQGIPPLVKLCEFGTPEGKDKAAACLWHLAIDSELQKGIANAGGIKPLVNLLAEGTPEGIQHASDALARLAFENSENQAQIAKKLVGLLDSNDAGVVSRAAHDLQSLAQSHPKAPMVIVSAGAISPLVSVLSNGKTEEGRNEASRTLYTLANSGEANQTAIAIGLVALLGVGTDLAQECVTELLLTLSSGDEADLGNRLAIAQAGPFKMLVQQLRSDNARVRMLAAAVMSRLSGDSTENAETIAACGGIQPLVKLLDSDGSELGTKSQHYSTIALADTTRSNQEHAVSVTKEGGIEKLISILRSTQNIDCKARAASALGSIAMEESRARDVGDAGGTEPILELLKSGNQFAQQASAFALAGIAAGGRKNQDHIKTAGGVDMLAELLKTVAPAESSPAQEEAKDHMLIQVQSNVAKALAELARDHETNQQVITQVGGIAPLIRLIDQAPTEQPKEEAAWSLWCLSSRNHENQCCIASLGGMESLVRLVGRTTARGQKMAAGALHSLALNHIENQTRISQLIVQLLRDSSTLGDSQEKAARAISRLARYDLDMDANGGKVPAHRNQDSLANAQCIGLIVSLLQPKRYDPAAAPNQASEEPDQTVSTGQHQLTQKELCAALWSLSETNENNQKLIASEGGIPLLIALLGDNPDIHCDAAGALWSLAAETNNQRLIAEAGGIPKLCELLRYGAVLTAQETATGALHRLASNARNRGLIADADGISLLIPLFDGGSAQTKQHVNDALLAVTQDNSSNQFLVTQGLVSMLASGPEDAHEAQTPQQISRVEAQTHCTQVLHTMSLDRDNRDAFSRTGTVVQLVRQLKSGSEQAQTMASDALSNIARMSADLRIQVTAQLVTLLSSNNPDVRQRAGTTLRDNKSDGGGEDKKQQKQAAISSGVKELVHLLKTGLDDGRVEAQEYALRSLSMITDVNRRRSMVQEGSIPAVTQSLRNGQLSADSQEHAIMVLACLSGDAENHDEIIAKQGISPLIDALSAGEKMSFVAKRFAAVGLAHLAADNEDRQNLLFEAIEPMVNWLTASTEDAGASLRPEAAHSLASICRGNKKLQLRVAKAKAINPLVSMLKAQEGSDSHDAASRSLATLAVDCSTNQQEIAQAGAIPLLIDLLHDSKPHIRESASFAIAMLSDLKENKVLIANAGGIKPVIELLSEGNNAAKQFAARAASLLASDNVENQLALVNAAAPLADLLGSDNPETQEWAQLALLRLAVNPTNRPVVVRPLVGVLSGQNTSAQLKAAECFAMLLERSPMSRTTIVKAGAIKPLMQLLGNGQRADLHTPPERAAAVLSKLVKLPESKEEVVSAGGLEPLVQMLSSSCKESQAHAACALWRLSKVAEHKPMIIALHSINPLVALLTDGTLWAQDCSARTLFQLSSLTEAKKLIVQANGISSLVTCLERVTTALYGRHESSENQGATGFSDVNIETTQMDWYHEEITDEHESFLEAREQMGELQPPASVYVTGQEQMRELQPLASVQEAAAAILSELARTQSANRVLIADAGGLPLIMEIVCEVSPSSLVQQHVTTALWGLSQEKPYRHKVARRGEVVVKLVKLLSSASGETQKLAAATLVTLGQEEISRMHMVSAIDADAQDTLQMLKFVKDSWLRSQVEQLIQLIGFSDPSTAVKSPGEKPSSPRVQAYSPRIMHNPAPLISYTAPIIPMPTSPRFIVGTGSRKSTNTGATEVLLARFQAKLEANPDLWMVKRPKHEEVTDLHMADLALEFRVGENVVVETEAAGARKAVVRFVGKVPEIAPGFWIGVEFETSEGKNDGSVNGSRYFSCQADYGSFLRPNRIKREGGSATHTRMLMAAKAAEITAATAKAQSQTSTEPSTPHRDHDVNSNGTLQEVDSPAVDQPLSAPLKASGKQGKEKPKLKLKPTDTKDPKNRVPTEHSSRSARSGSQRSTPKGSSPKSSSTPESATSTKQKTAKKPKK